MGQYRLAVYTNLSFGVMVEFDRQPMSIEIRLPFLLIYIGLEKYASGFQFPWSE